MFARPTFEDYADAGLSQLRRAAGSDYSVTMHVLDVLGFLSELTRRPERLEPLRAQLRAVVAAAKLGPFSEDEVFEIRQRAAHVGRQGCGPGPVGTVR